MAEEKKHEFDSNAFLDLSIRRTVYFSTIGAVGGLFFPRSPARWSAVAFGVGAALGSAYTESSYKFPKYEHHVSDAAEVDH